MTYLQPPIDILLRHHFDTTLEGTIGVGRRRIEQVERLLREFLESDGPRTLCPCNLTILAAEGEFQPEAAFTRAMHADELLFALPLFLGEVAPQTDPLLRRVLLRTVEGLTRMLVGDGLVDQQDQMGTLWEIRYTLDRAKAELNGPRREKQRAARQAVEEEMARRRAALTASLLRSRGES